MEQLTSKQGRHDRFKNVKERDEWLRSTIKELTIALKTTQEHLRRAEMTRNETMNDVEGIRKVVSELESRVAGRKNLVEQIDSEFRKCQEKKEELELERK